MDHFLHSGLVIQKMNEVLGQERKLGQGQVRERVRELEQVRGLVRELEQVRGLGQEQEQERELELGLEQERELELGLGLGQVRMTLSVLPISLAILVSKTLHSRVGCQMDG